METSVKDYSMVLSQVYEILQYLPKEYFKRVPNKMVEEIRKNKSSEYIFTYDIDKGLDDSAIFEETKDLMSAIYVSYLCDEKRKTEIIEICRQNDIKLQKDLNEKYNVDNLFKKQEVKNTVLENTTDEIGDTQALIPKEEKWYTTVLNKIKEFLVSLKK